VAKSKEQKQIEAGWRKIRGDLVDAYRRGEDAKVSKEYGAYFVENRKELWEKYKELPWSWRSTAMDGWNLPANLVKLLGEEEIVQGAITLDQATMAASAPNRRRRM
jgi:hypothetical protein